MHGVGGMRFSGIRAHMRDCSSQVHDTARCGTAWFVELVQLKALEDEVPANLMALRSNVLGYAIVQGKSTC